MNLYTITTDLAALRELAENDDLTTDDQAQVTAMIDTVLTDLLPAKVEAYCGLIRSLKLEAEAFQAEEKRLAGRRAALKNLGARLAERLQAGLTAAGLDELRAGVFTAAIQASPPALEVALGAEIPERFLVAQEPKIDRKALLAAVKGGEEIPGCRLTQGKHLRIR